MLYKNAKSLKFNIIEKLYGISRIKGKQWQSFFLLTVDPSPRQEISSFPENLSKILLTNSFQTSKTPSDTHQRLQLFLWLNDWYFLLTPILPAIQNEILFIRELCNGL